MFGSQLASPLPPDKKQQVVESIPPSFFDFKNVVELEGMVGLENGIEAGRKRQRGGGGALSRRGVSMTQTAWPRPRRDKLVFTWSLGRSERESNQQRREGQMMGFLGCVEKGTGEVYLDVKVRC